MKIFLVSDFRQIGWVIYQLKNKGKSKKSILRGKWISFAFHSSVVSTSLALLILFVPSALNVWISFTVEETHCSLQNKADTTKQCRLHILIHCGKSGSFPSSFSHSQLKRQFLGLKGRFWCTNRMVVFEAFFFSKCPG